MPLGDVAIALMAGNGVVLKPSPFACLCGERVARAFARAGLPEGLLQVVHGGAATGRALVEAPVAQVRLTGSAEVGRGVGELAARALRPTTLALSGKDAMLVLADAPDRARDRRRGWGAFANAGQAGGSIERAFVAALALRPVPRRRGRRAPRTARRRPARPGDRGRAADVAPSASRACAELVDDAVARGATLHCGGPRDEALLRPRRPDRRARRTPRSRARRSRARC